MANKRVTPKKAKAATTTAKEWKSGKTTDLKLPSGNVCLVRKPDGMKAFMVNGKIPNSLMPLVSDALDSKSDGELDMKAVMEDPQRMKDLMEMIDSITVSTVVEPAVLPVPNNVDEKTGAITPVPHDERDDEILYVDEIDTEDKLMIMGWALGGVKDLEQFRETTTDRVATLVDVQDLPESTLINSGDTSGDL